MDLVKQISSLLNSGKINIGAKAVEKDLLLANPKAVLIAKGAKESLKERLIYLANLSKVPFAVLDFNPKDMGEKFGKAYAVSAVSVLDVGHSKILECLKK